MTDIKLVGAPPFDLPIAQSAEARAEGEIVQLILTVLSPGTPQRLAQVRVPMTWETARALGSQLGPVSMTAEIRARRG
jgi:hypothetical protein